MPKRSYFQEISELTSTWSTIWNSPPLNVQLLPPSILRGTSFCIGSGGSLVLARLWQQIHENHDLGLAKAMTPYEYNHTKCISDVVILFSASGRNHDILQVFKTAIQRGSKIVVITVTPESPLVRLVKSFPDSAYALFPNNSTPKDGFLAVNSIISMACLICHIERYLLGEKFDKSSPVSLAINDYTKYTSIINDFDTLQIIASEWGIPAGHDLETRLSESGVAGCFITDPRSFGHGRFIWLEKHKENTLIVIIHTPDSASFVNRFIKLLPEFIPQHVISAPYPGTFGAIYCMVTTMLLFGDLAKVKLLDPGQPDVPEWGRKLHRLQLNTRNKNSFTTGIPKEFPVFNMPFNSMVVDIDGTMIDTEKRFNGIAEEINNEIIKLLNSGLRMGFATGRGGSGIDMLKAAIPERYWDKTVIGLYNGTVVIRLSDNYIDLGNDSIIWGKISSLIKDLFQGNAQEVSIRSTQISIRGLKSEVVSQLKEKLTEELGQRARFIKILSSAHSIDILPHTASKLSVVEAIDDSLEKNILCVGDQGQNGGNDEDLLMWKPSVSVGKQRPTSNTCFWLGKDKNLRESKGLLVLLKSIERHDTAFYVNYELIKKNMEGLNS